MVKSKNMDFKSRPSALVTLLVALLGSRWKFNADKDYVEITGTRNGEKINERHLRDFNEMCGLVSTGNLSLIYPLTLIYPFYLRMMAHRYAPLSLYSALNTRVQIAQHRVIRSDERQDISCRLHGTRIVPNGLELDVSARIAIGDECVWENINTYLYRGHYGEADPSYIPRRYVPLADIDFYDSWYLPEGCGLRFARISGDSNGLHYSKLYARLKGFDRDFAQPFLVMGNSIRLIPEQDFVDSVYLDIALRGPAYYGSTIRVEGQTVSHDHRFDIYCGTNPKPCFSGILTAMENRSGSGLELHTFQE